MQDASDPSSPAAVAAADSAAADVSQPAAAAPVMQHCEAATQTAAGVLPAPPAQPRTAYMLFTLEFRHASIPAAGCCNHQRMMHACTAIFH